jgi:hypothetical protein
LTRFHGVFAPHSKLRAAVTPARRGVGGPGQGADQPADQPITPCHVAMTLSAASEARVRHRDQHLCPLWRQAQGDRQHRGARADCKDSGASGEERTGSESIRAATGRPRTAEASAADLIMNLPTHRLFRQLHLWVGAAAVLARDSIRCGISGGDWISGARSGVTRPGRLPSVARSAAAVKPQFVGKTGKN